MDEAMYRNQFRWLQTGDESFDYWGYPAQGRWEIYGLDLPIRCWRKSITRMLSGCSGNSRAESREGHNEILDFDLGRPGRPRDSLLDAGELHHPPAKTEPTPARPSQIKVDVRPGGPVILTTSSAEFQVLPSGYIQASLLKADQRLTLDKPRAGGSDFLVQDGKEVQFVLDLGQAKIQDSVGKLGRGKLVEISARPAEGAAAGVQRTLRIEVYDDFPTILLSSAEYKNTGVGDFHIDRVVAQQHKFSGSMVDKKAPAYDMWSFHGSSYDWGKDDVVKLTRTFSQPNLMGAQVKGWLRRWDSGGCLSGRRRSARPLGTSRPCL